jgi:RimJ/RimL family protein N-acetyltransferase
MRRRHSEGPPETIAVDNLVLRRHRVSDAAAIAQAVKDSLADLQPWMPWADERSASTEFQRIRLRQEKPFWDNGSVYTYLITREADGRLLGIVGLHRRVGAGALEVGYWLRTGETGSGVMTSAVKAVTGAALALPGIHKVELHCDEANRRSAGVARRAGYTLTTIRAKEPEAPAETGREMIWVMEGPDSDGEPG